MNPQELLPHQRKGSWLRTIKAVLWSFAGLRSRKAFQDDVEKLNPIHIILTGLVLAVLFVLGLLALVNWVVQQPTGF